ncbi:hypothetical protein GTA08_BOTSDO08062 [Botryosphaeria dothidea]|uniref:Uncharacterized protein n=1 Tax=Botryosphaeria dothidea TaxID=55169 RepID=A0A8H4ING9_9PEZI|nr:hypothetical protein GTA08_BOTSDO08062 [Botryosphaeria dothidea]
MCLVPYMWRRASVSVTQDYEDFSRSIRILRSLQDGSDAVSASIPAFFDISPTSTVNIIRHSLVDHERLGPVEYYPVSRHDVAIPAAGALPLRIIGELRARWCGTDRNVLGQRIAFAPKYYSSSFLVTDDELYSPYDVIFGLQTMSVLHLVC